MNASWKDLAYLFIAKWKTTENNTKNKSSLEEINTNFLSWFDNWDFICCVHQTDIYVLYGTSLQWCFGLVNSEQEHGAFVSLHWQLNEIRNVIDSSYHLLMNVFFSWGKYFSLLRQAFKGALAPDKNTGLLLR